MHACAVMTDIIVRVRLCDGVDLQSLRRGSEYIVQSAYIAFPLAHWLTLAALGSSVASVGRREAEARVRRR